MMGYHFHQNHKPLEHIPSLYFYVLVVEIIYLLVQNAENRQIQL